MTTVRLFQIDPVCKLARFVRLQHLIIYFNVCFNFAVLIIFFLNFAPITMARLSANTYNINIYIPNINLIIYVQGKSCSEKFCLRLYSNLNQKLNFLGKISLFFKKSNMLKIFLNVFSNSILI